MNSVKTEHWSHPSKHQNAKHINEWCALLCAASKWTTHILTRWRCKHLNLKSTSTAVFVCGVFLMPFLGMCHYGTFSTRNANHSLFLFMMQNWLQSQIEPLRRRWRRWWWCAIHVTQTLWPLSVTIITTTAATATAAAGIPSVHKFIMANFSKWSKMFVRKPEVAKCLFDDCHWTGIWCAMR